MDDVLRPPLVWIDGRCYRKLRFEQNYGKPNLPSEELPSQHYQEQDVTYEDEACDDLVDETSKGFKTVMDTPSALFKFIIGKKGETKKRIESETNTRISIPNQGQAGDLVITGPHKAGVLSARNKVDIIAESSRQKCTFTHFLSFPLYFDELSTRAAEFKQKVLQQFAQSKGIDDSIFQKPCKLHLTIGMLVLLSDVEVKNAAKFLSSCSKDLIRECLANKAVNVRLAGVEYMNDDPSSVDVLYAKVHEIDGKQRVQHLADSLVERFVEHGIMQREYDRVKLHVTLMNSKLHSELAEELQEATQKRHGGFSKMKNKYSFDASELVQVFKDFNFGEYHISEIHMSERGNYDEHGHYCCAASIPLP